MRISIILLISLVYTAGIAQEEFKSERPVISIGCQNISIIVPYNLSVGLATNNLKNQFRLSYNIIIIPSGLQFGYQRYFYKKRGVQIGINYIQFLRKFNYANPQTKKYELIGNLNMFKAEIGYYFRFKMHDFGVFEPSFTISYQYPINSNSKLFFKEYSSFDEYFFNINLRYYFKRNKPKLTKE